MRLSISTPLRERFDADHGGDAGLLRERGVISGGVDAMKVLARGELTKKLTVRAHKFSGKAAEKIAAAGGPRSR